MRRLLIAAPLLLLAADPALAQGKVWEKGKVLTCTVTTMHSCKEQNCETQQITAEVRLDLDTKKACIVQSGNCTDTEDIGPTKVVDRVFILFIGPEKEDGTLFRIWDDGRFTAVGLREISGEGGYVMLGTCAAK